MSATGARTSTNRRLTARLLSALFGVLLPLAATAQTAAPATRPAVKGPAPREAVERRTVANPKSAEDLRSIERQVSTVLEQAIPATVGIAFGGSQGSGVIVSSDGYVLTAGHVSGPPGRNAVVILSDGRRLKGVTLGRNDDADTGMVKIIDPGEYPFVGMGRAGDLSVGQWAIALGHPGGYRRDRPPVVRVGRLLTVNDVFLDSDCTLIGGDSGGPLLNLGGQVIGIHSRIGATTLLNMHVPIDQFTQTWAQLANGDDLTAKPAYQARSAPTSAYLGINGADDPLGCRVTTVTDDTTAAKAGVQEGDVITRINNQPIKGLTDLHKLLERKRVGEDVTIEVLRDGEEAPLSLKAKLGGRPQK